MAEQYCEDQDHINHQDLGPEASLRYLTGYAIVVSRRFRKPLEEEETLDQNRSRRNGGGKTPLLEKEAKKNINDIVLAILKEHTAGDPMDEKVK